MFMSFLAQIFLEIILLSDNFSGFRAVAQLGSALEWGSRGRGFESRRPEGG